MPSGTASSRCSGRSRISARARLSPRALISLHFFAHEVEPLEGRLVRHDEQVGLAAYRLVAGESPVRDGEYVVLRPFKTVLADGRPAAARHDEADHVVGAAASPRAPAG